MTSIYQTIEYECWLTGLHYGEYSEIVRRESGFPVSVETYLQLSRVFNDDTDRLINEGLNDQAN